MIYKSYLKILKEVKDSVPPEGKSASDGMIIQKPGMIHYAPTKYIDSISKEGLLPQKLLVKKHPEMKEMLAKKWKDIVANKLDVSRDRINANNIVEYLDMLHPGNSRCVFAFFSRIPEGIQQYKEYLKSHTPIKILLKKLDSSDEKFKVHGVNFHSIKNWPTLNKDNIQKLCKGGKDWYGYFADADPNNFFQRVPHAAIHTKTGGIPPFALKVLEECEMPHR